MKRILLLLAALFSAEAQAQPYTVLTTCGTLSPPYELTLRTAQPTIDVNGNLCNTGGVTAGLLNYQPGSLGRYRAALANVRAGTGALKIAFIGDSTTMGYRSNATINLSRLNGYPVRVGTMLSSTIQPTTTDSIFGNGSNNSGDLFNKYDTRWSTTGSWLQNGFISAGGQMLTTTGAGTLSFTPPSGLSIDSADIYYRNSTTAAQSFTINVDGGGTLATVTTNTSVNSIGKSTVTFAAGSSHVINMVWVSGTAAISGVDTYLSTVPRIRILNLGIFGSTSTDWANTVVGSFTPVPAVGVIAPALCIINIGINDWLNSTGVATYVANMQSIITTLTTTCDIILVSPTPTNTSGIAAAVQQQYVTAVEGLAISNRLPYIALFERFGSYATANALGFMGDSNHPSNLGYWDIAQVVVNAISVQP